MTGIGKAAISEAGVRLPTIRVTSAQNLMVGCALGGVGFVAMSGVIATSAPLMSPVLIVAGLFPLIGSREQRRQAAP